MDIPLTNLSGTEHHDGYPEDEPSEDDPSEDEPLLPASPEVKPSIPFPPTPSPRPIIALLTGVTFILNFGGFIMTMPLTRVCEDIICQHYYANLSEPSPPRPISEALCKGDPVQSELAIVIGGKFFTTCLPSLALSIPYGLLADRIGRKPVFLLSMAGSLLSELSGLAILWWWRVFPLRLIWATPIWQIIGGSYPVGSAMIYACVADVAPEETRAQTFLVLIGGGLAAQILGPLLSSYLMMWSSWPPILLGIAMIALGTVLFLFVPETLHLRSPESPTMPILGSPLASPFSLRPASLFVLIKKHLRTTLASSSTFTSLPILLLLSTFSFVILATQIVQLSLRDISARFNWSLAQSGLLLSLRALIDMAVVILLLPLASHILTQPRHGMGLALSTRAKDYLLALASTSIMVLGSMLLALSPPLPVVLAALAVFALGSGLGGLCRALVTELVPREQVGKLYAAIGVVEVLGSVVGGPGLAWLYRVGLELRGWWRGGPFVMVAVVGVWCGGALVVARRVEGRTRMDRDRGVDD